MTLSINGKTYEAGELIAYVEKLENENAELKTESDFYNKERGNYKALFLKANLKNNKAKEIIKTLADDLSVYSGNYQKELLEAEQFLNSEVEK